MRSRLQNQSLWLFLHSNFWYGTLQKVYRTQLSAFGSSGSFTLEGKGKSVVWYDDRNGASSMDLINSANSLAGIILNKPIRKLGGLWSSTWLTLHNINGIWYNLDSDLAFPLPFEKGYEEMKEFLHQSLTQVGEVLGVFEGNSSASNNPHKQ